MIFSATQPRIDLESLIRNESSRTSITSIVGIQNCFISENKEYRSKLKMIQMILNIYYQLKVKI